MPAASTLALNPTLPIDALRREFADRRRIEIGDFLSPPAAEELRAHLVERNDWVLVMNAGEKVFEIPRSRLSELDEEQRRRLDESVAAAARSGFQFRYETIRVADDAAGRTASDTLLDRFVGFLSSPPVVELFQRITGRDDIDFADGQATAYSSGHFLTRHDDDVVGKNRKAAYVFGLTPVWRPEWGGLLMFHGADGDIEQAFTPAMGALRLFAVPVSHSVSYVTPFAPEPRLSITGWLRGAGPQSTE